MAQAKERTITETPPPLGALMEKSPSVRMGIVALLIQKSAQTVLGDDLEEKAREDLITRRADKTHRGNNALKYNAGAFMAAAQELGVTQWDNFMTYLSAAYYRESVSQSLENLKRDREKELRIAESGDIYNRHPVRKFTLNKTELDAIRKADRDQKATVMNTIFRKRTSTPQEETQMTFLTTQIGKKSETLTAINTKLELYEEPNGITYKQAAQVRDLASFINKDPRKGTSKDSQTKAAVTPDRFPNLYRKSPQTPK